MRFNRDSPNKRKKEISVMLRERLIGKELPRKKKKENKESKKENKERKREDKEILIERKKLKQQPDKLKWIILKS
jgi:hypothetical protein